MLKLRERPLLIGLAAIVAGTLLVSLAGLQPHDEGAGHAITLVSPPVALAATVLSIVAGLLLILRALRSGAALGVIGALLVYAGVIGGHIWASCDPSLRAPTALVAAALIFGTVFLAWTGPMVVTVAVGLAWVDVQVRPRSWGQYAILALLVACCLAGPIVALAEARAGVVPHAGCVL